jgi:glycosyltransferase involved in cell wall biosynthesis
MNFNKFVFIIPSYNNSDWYEYNIKSIAKQHYDNWRAIYIDDASTDGTLKLLKV